MKIVNSRKRKAISPVLATVILIAITLIAAVAIATFVFGIFGTSAAPAQLSVQSSPAASCVVTGTSWVCTAYVQNGGTTAGSITGAGPGGVAVSPTGAKSIAANSANNVVTFTVQGSNFASGQTIQAYFAQGNGPNLFFTLVLP